MASIWTELKRRNVVRVAIAYAVVSWLDHAYERRDRALAMLIGDPFMENLYDDPRFDLIVDRIGRTPCWERYKNEQSTQ